MTLQHAEEIIEKLRTELLEFAKQVGELREKHPAFIRDDDTDITYACMFYPLVLKTALKSSPTTLNQLSYRIRSMNQTIENFDYALKFIKADVLDAYLYDNRLETIDSETKEKVLNHDLKNNKYYVVAKATQDEIIRVRDQLVAIHNNLTDQKQDTPTKTPE